MAKFPWFGKPKTPAQLAERGVSAVKKILVPVRGTTYNDRAVELACRLGVDQKAEIVLCHVLVVPLAQPISTSLPDAQRLATEYLGRARSIVEHHGMKSLVVTQRERDVARGILHAAQEHDVAMVVFGINPKNQTAGEAMGAATEQLLRKSHIEVIVDMHPEPEAEGEPA